MVRAADAVRVEGQLPLSGTSMLKVSRKFPAGPGTPGGTRTRTRALLRRLPLPLGYGGASRDGPGCLCLNL